MLSQSTTNIQNRVNTTEMSKTDTSECVVDGCTEIFDSTRGARIHFRYHTEAEKRAALLDEIINLSSQKGRTPTAGEMDEDGPFSVTTYQNYFDSWTEAVKRAGLEPRRETNFGDTDLISEIKRLAEQLDRVPTAGDVLKRSRYALRDFQKQFGSWNEALQRAGYQVNAAMDIPEKELLAEIHQLYEDLGRVPSKTDMAEYGYFAPRTYQLEFGTWNDAIVSAGYEPNQTFDSEWNYYYGPDWDATRELVIQRDDEMCRCCGKPRCDCEQDLNVHHIKPARELPIDGNSEDNTLNDPSNLISLCPSCHHKFEGQWTDSDPSSFAEKARLSLTVD